MFLFDKEMREWNVEDLHTLIDSEEIKESGRLDYKQSFGRDEAFQDDVSAFSNSNGGFILFGVKEKRNDGKKTGIAEELCGIKNEGSDEFNRKIGESLSRMIFPSRPSYETAIIPLTDDLCVLCLRIFEGYDKPYCSRQTMKFQLRGNAGNELMSYQRLQEMFNQNLLMQDRLTGFVNTRIEFLTDSRNGKYFDFSKLPLLAIHYIPVISIYGRNRSFNIRDFHIESVNSNKRTEYPWKSSIQRKKNVDGILFFNRSSQEMRANIQVFRNGCVEFATDFFSKKQHSTREVVVQTIGIVHEIYREIKMDKPFVCFVSFENTHLHENRGHFERQSIRSMGIEFIDTTDLSANGQQKVEDELEFMLG